MPIDRERLLDLAEALGSCPDDADTLTFRREGRASWRLDWTPDGGEPLVARWSARGSRSFEATEDDGPGVRPLRASLDDDAALDIVLRVERRRAA